MRIAAIEPLSALTEDEHELARRAFDSLFEGFFLVDEALSRGELVLYVLEDEQGGRRIVAPRDDTIFVGDDISELTSPAAIFEMSTAQSAGSTDLPM